MGAVPDCPQMSCFVPVCPLLSRFVPVLGPKKDKRGQTKTKRDIVWTSFSWFYKHLSSQRRVHTVVNMAGVVKNHYGVVIHYPIAFFINSVWTRCIVKTSAFTRGVCKNQQFYIKFKWFSCGIPRQQALLRKSSKPTENRQKSGLFWASPFTMDLVWHTAENHISNSLTIGQKQFAM